MNRPPPDRTWTKVKRIPPKPERKMVRRVAYPDKDKISIKALLEQGVPEDATITIEEDYGYGDYEGHLISTNLVVEWEEPEPFRTYEARLARWEKNYGGKNE